MDIEGIKEDLGWAASLAEKEVMPNLASRLRDLASQVEALQADAERYRYLRNEAHPDREDSGIAVQEQDWNDWGKPYNRFYSGKELDEKVDAARRAE